MAKILVTGTAGFIGFHLAKVLLEKGHTVVGLDNINDYYIIDLKYARLEALGINREDIGWNKKNKSTLFDRHFFYRTNLEDKMQLKKIFVEYSFDYVINLAAQAGVRYSLENPDVYVQSNIVGFLNILECCRYHNIKHLLYASSSSVYGQNKSMPFSVLDNVDNPISLYAATKKSNELMAHTYSHLYNIPTTGLRFFTVYGPWGRPDMAIYLFTKAILEAKPINIFNNGEMKRDFTFIDDIIQGIELVLKAPPVQDQDKPPFNLVNIGNGKPECLMDFVKAIESNLGVEAIKNYLPMQPGDVPATWADISSLKEIGYKSTTQIDEGIRLFVNWYKSYNFKNE